MTNTSEQTSATTREFTLDLLKQITDNFSEDHVIGRGGFGVVYKGVLENGEEIALKKLHYNSVLDDTQFRNEFNNLMRAQHPNITRLVGYCYFLGHQRIDYNGEYIFAHVAERVLCFEYLHGGSLDKHISDESCGLGWHTRFKIIRGVSEGLNYLHNGCKDPIFHLDLKPENILLDKDLVPKIGDFGLSKLFPSAQTCITSKIMGTVGYMPPEYTERREITSKFDVFSLGVILLQIVAGSEGYYKFARMPSQGFLEHVCENWGKRLRATTSLHTLEQLRRCIEIAIRCVDVDRMKRPAITEIVDELNKIDATKSSPIGQDTERQEHTTLGKEVEIQEPKKLGTKEQVAIRTKRNLPPFTMSLPKAIGITDAISSMLSRWIGSDEGYLKDDVLHLQSGLHRLRDTLPGMYHLIDGAEWKSHEHYVSMLLPKLKDAVYEADDLLDEFRWYEMKGKLEGDASKSPIGFFDSVIQGNFNKLNDIQGRLDHLSSQLERMGLRETTQRFDKLVRPETSSLPNEETIFGRKRELKQVMEFLSVPINSEQRRPRNVINVSTSTLSRTSQGNQHSNESRITNLAVLPIVGIGGVGKTTLAQHVCSHEQVKAHFELVIWICVSDDFDVKRLTKEVTQSCPGNTETTDNLDSLQRALSNKVNNKRFLIVLDDLWDDALKEDGQCWKRFCAPLKGAREGSMMLVTTRCPKVAELVRTMEPIIVEGLKDEVFWNFFKLCVFGPESSNSDPELERIGRSILPKLKGSPLAAKTLGRILRMDLQVSHWSSILESELWELRQEATDILPALRLSYMYLPFYLKQCFSFCAVYPKDYKFKKEDLAEIWVAEGFVEPHGDDPLQDIGCRYFEDLVTRSFFEKVNDQYVIHDLLHDMAQKVSEHDCFIIRNKNDFDKVPRSIRHIYILPNSGIVSSNLLSLCKHTKLRTLICKKQLMDKSSSVMDNWCTKLLRMRVISCDSTNELPDSIGNLKHLRYLKISKGCPVRIPSALCRLYNLQIFDVKNGKIESLPGDFSNLINLQRFTSKGFTIHHNLCHIDASNKHEVEGIKLMKNLNQMRGSAVITNVCMLSKDRAEEIGLKNKKYLTRLELGWLDQDKTAIMQHNATEVLQVLQPHVNLRCLILERYPGGSLPRWFQNLPSLTSLTLYDCYGLESISLSMISQNMDLHEITAMLDHNNNGNIGIFLSLTDIAIYECHNLSSLKYFLHPDYVPFIKKISLQNCKSLVSVPTDRFGDLSFLEELDVNGCPHIRSQSLVSPSLKHLKLGDCGSLLDNIDCCSVTKFSISTESVKFIQPQMWSLPALHELEFQWCSSLTFIGVSLALDNSKDSIGIFPSLTELIISRCQNLSSLEHFLHPGYLPAIKKISLQNCKSLLSIRTERFGDLSFLEQLDVDGCPNICSQSLVSSSLKWLNLGDCGSLLDNIDCCSVTKFIISTDSATSIQPQMWSLPALQELKFTRCKSLTSVGVSTSFPLCAGTDNIRAFSKLNIMAFEYCDKLSIVDDGLLTQGYLPAIERITVTKCPELLSLPSERFGSFPGLKHFTISLCPHLDWQRGLVLPSSLQSLFLAECGDFSACVPDCLENLTSLVSLTMGGCQGITSIRSNLWRKLALLEQLTIGRCPNLASIGGTEAIAKIKRVFVYDCPNLKEAKQIMKRGRRSSRRN